MNESFLTKYKPYYIKEFRLNSITETALYTFLEMDDLNMLLYGNSGCGKTMLLESIIREYYKLEKTDTLPENNILYINNLKEQGIQYYRNDMKCFCQTRSIIPGKKKMIVIDDIDNVNEQSQQVFRNYMDRYRNNVHFIAVCTNMQKVIESIQSRMHIIQIHPLTLEEIRWHLDDILNKEEITMNNECKEYLLSICNFSVRIITNYVEKLYILNEPITLDLCKQVCSNISFHHFEKYISAFKEKKLKEGIQILYDIFDTGYSVIDILDYFFLFVKSTPLISEENKYKIIPYLCKYITIFHNIHEDKIELALFTNSIFQEITL